MGLDIVDLVLRCEEFYNIHLPDAELESISTVHEFYSVICTHLGVSPDPHPTTPAELPIITAKEPARFFGSRHTPLPPPPGLLPWTPATVWSALVAIFVDQQVLKPAAILPGARIVQDLGID